MKIIHTIRELRDELHNKPSIAFVPTMGNLHAGHLHLVELAKQRAECVVVSIFVNPLQFGANEDLASYPRTQSADCDKLSQVGADIVFAPSVAEMYPDFDGVSLHQTMVIRPPTIANVLCGVSRPDHFTGVATVVMKLFNIVKPNVVIFGKKDFQQLTIIRELVKQFNMDIEIVGGETVREPNGLAMSSRNGYLDFVEKPKAVQLFRTLTDVVNKIHQGQHNYTELEHLAIKQLDSQGWQVDYISIRSAQSLLPAVATDQNLVVLGAAKLGKTRLIDNIEFCAKPLN
jgi:pantoate--beta-alanine ligase